MNTGNCSDSVQPTAIVVLLLAWGLTACSTHSIPPTQAGCVSCDEAGRFVRVQTVPETGRAEATPPFTHPFRLSPEGWRPLLERIQVRQHGQGPFYFLAAEKPIQPVFTPQEIQFLSVRLPLVFAEARPSDLVVFGLTNTRTPDITDHTTGAWYVKGSTLTLILSNYREGVTMPNIREWLRQDPLHIIAAPLYDFVPGPHQTVVGTSTALHSLFIPEAIQLSMAYQPLSDTSSEKDARPAAQPDMSLETKLERLKRMYDAGLITAEEYATKKKSLLDGL